MRIDKFQNLHFFQFPVIGNLNKLFYYD